MLSLRPMEAMLCSSIVDDFWHHLGSAYKVDVVHVCEGLHFGADFHQEWLNGKAEQEWSHGVSLPHTRC